MRSKKVSRIALIEPDNGNKEVKPEGQWLQGFLKLLNWMVRLKRIMAFGYQADMKADAAIPPFVEI